MRRRTGFATTVCFVCASVAFAQSPPNPSPSSSSAKGTTAIEASTVVEAGATEWKVTGGPAFSLVLFHSVRDHRYVLSTLSWSRILTRPSGPGVLRGRFAWAFEAVPLYGQLAPDDIYGLGITPMVGRWNFEPHGKYAPFLEVGGGALWTQNAVPVLASSANFTAHGSAAVRIFVRSREAVIVGYRFHHISNGNRIRRNPGVNAHVLEIGWSHFPERR
jgi:hypothetical protein